MKHLYITFAVAAFGSLTLAGQQQVPAQPPQQPKEVTITLGGSGGPPKIGIAGFIPASSDAESAAAAKTIGDVLYDDLNYEREYYMIGKDAIATVPKPASIDGVPLDRWKELNADGVIVGSIRKTPAGVTVQVKLIQVGTGRVAFAKEYSGAIANPRRYAHTISDDIFQQQLALPGVARTKLAFASDRDAERMKGPVGDRETKEIYIADYDGANPQRVTNTKTLNIAPSWSPDGEIIAYSSWRPSGPGGFGTFQDIVLSVIHKGLWETPAHGNPNKQNYLPAWSPDGTKIAFTCTRNNNQDICVMNRDGSGLHAITTNPAVDVSPTWSPTGTQIAWVSDRTGARRSTS
jgi:TolB protein